MKIAGISHILRNDKTFLVINTCLGLLLLVAAMFLIRDILSAVRPAAEKKMSSGKQQEHVEVNTLQDYSAIFTSNPFGFAAGELKPISAVSGPAVAQSDISLIGTVAGRSELSYAIFADKSGQQEVFRTGQKVFGLGKLDRVEKDRVFITGSGKPLEIPLAEFASVKEISRPGAASAPFARRVGDSTYYLDQDRIQNALDKPSQIMTDARFIPHVVDGKQQGFTLAEVKHGGIYQSLGLQNGDILLRINEYSISNPEAALQAFTALKGIDRAQLDIIRNGSKMTMSYQIR